LGPGTVRVETNATHYSTAGFITIVKKFYGTGASQSEKNENVNWFQDQRILISKFHEYDNQQIKYNLGST
jgi:hypothetical protein